MTYRLRQSADCRKLPWQRFAEHNPPHTPLHEVEYVTKELIDGNRLSWQVIYRYNGKLFRCLKSTWERDYQKVEETK